MSQHNTVFQLTTSLDKLPNYKLMQAHYFVIMQKVQFINFGQHTNKICPWKSSKRSLYVHRTKIIFIFRKFIYKRGLFWIVEIFE